MNKQLVSVLVAVFFSAAAYTVLAEQASVSPPAASLGALQFAIGPGSLGNPSGTMSGYAQGDAITLSCPGVTFSIAPIVGVTAESSGAVTGVIMNNPGVASTAPSGSITCSQASTTGSGTGYQVSVQFGPIGAYLSLAKISTGGGNTGSNQILGAETPTASYAGVEGAFFGDRAGGNFTGYAVQNSAFGTNSCGVGASPGSIAQATGSGNACFGAGAGRNISGSAANNTLLGLFAGGNETDTGTGLLTGSNNSCIGSATCENLGSAQNNTVVGQGSGAGALGNSNTVIGADAAESVTTSRSTVIGQDVGNTNLGSGTDDLIIGTGGKGCDVQVANTTGEADICVDSASPVIRITGGASPTTASTILSGILTVSGIGSDTGQTDATVCESTTTHQFYSGSGTAGICLGTSSMRFKDAIKPLTADALDGIAALKPKTFHYKVGYGDGGAKEQVGFIAEDVVKVFPGFVSRDTSGKPLSVDYMGIAVMTTRAVQQLKMQNDALEKRLARLEGRRRGH